jgi:hypothetical protein
MQRFLIVLAHSLLASGLMITPYASASAATVDHSRHVIVHRSQHYAVPGWASVAPPSYDDPSKSGSEQALPVR